MLRVDLDNGKVDVEQYWQLEDLLTKSYCKDHLEAYRNAFDHAVLKRLKQTQTLGIELSGGLDSSSIMASLMMQKPDTNVHCFSRAYFALEKQLIQSISDHYPSKNNYLWDDPNTSHHGFQKSLNDYIQLFGLPDEHSLAIDTHTFLETAREQNITTLLSGFGGDEFSSSLARDVILQLVDERRFFSAYARLSGNPIKRIFEVVRLSLKKPRRPDYLPAMLCLDNEDVINVKTQQYDFYQQLSFERSHNHRLIKQWRQSGVTRLESHSLAAASKGVSFHWPFIDENLLACFFSSPVTQRLGANGKTRWLHRQAF